MRKARRIALLMASVLALGPVVGMTEAAAVEKDIKFYGKIVEYTSGELMCEALTEALADTYNIECLQVDWGNLDTIIRTGISSGEPCDVYEYWTTSMRPLVDSGMCLDLTDYLMENDGEWYNTFVEGTVESGMYDGKYYGVPLNSNYSVMIGNKALLEEAGIEIPEFWTWEEFMDACAKIKETGIFAVAANTDNQQANWWFRNGLLSLSVGADKVEEMASGQIPCTDEIFTTCFNNVADLYAGSYAYPGEGAVTLTLDEAKAAFYQGKAAMFYSTSGSLAANLEGADFETVLIPWPSMGTANAILGGFDGLFIPANVEDPDAAVEVLKTYLSADIQAIHAEHGFCIVNNGVEVTDELTKKLIEDSKYICTSEFINLDAKVQEYITNQALAEVVLGGGVDAALNALEELRAAAVA